MSRSLLIIVLISLFSGVSFGRQMWLSPSGFLLGDNSSDLSLSLVSGVDLANGIEERPYRKGDTLMLKMFSATSQKDLRPSAVDGAKPFLSYRLESNGIFQFAYDRDAEFSRLDAKAFEKYLLDERMPHIIKLRRERGESAKAGRERSFRCLKTIVKVGNAPGKFSSKPVGQKLEIVLLEDPFQKRIGDSLRFRVFFDGKPYSKQSVFISNRSLPKQRLLTDRLGNATMRLTKGGMWLIHLTSMEKCKRDCGEADWESVWSSLSFEIR